MSRLSDRKSNTLGTIASIQTLLERYPTLTTTDPMLTNFSLNTSLGFMLDVLRVIGVTQNDIIGWLTKLITGDPKKGTGVLEGIEKAVKLILLTNIKDIFTCSVNPIIPDSVMKYVYDDDGQPDSMNAGLEINLNVVDLFGQLKSTPTDEKGGIFYFDTQDYNPNTVWKSADFNAFLWYVINKGSITSESDRIRNTWDNRVAYIKKFENDQILKDNFFSVVTGSTETSGATINIKGTDEDVLKKQIIICEYVERADSSTYNTNSDVLKVWLNANRYKRTVKLDKKNGEVESEAGEENVGNNIANQVADIEVGLNKTIFEFNYDYIYSLKLFDSKTLVAQVLNSMLGLGASLSVSYSVQLKFIEAKVNEIVKKIIESDDTETNECYFTFSNAEYDTMLRRAQEQHEGVYNTKNGYNTYASVDGDAIADALARIDESATLVEKTQTISKILQDVAATAATNSSLEVNQEFTWGLNFIYDFIQQTMTQIVVEVLSPKVAILYAINSAFMGDAGNMKSWEHFLDNFQNVIVMIVRQIKDIIIQELYQFLMDQLKPLIDLFIAKIALETVKNYKDLITNLIENCIPNVGFQFNKRQSVIDNVNYADIVPKQESNDVKKC